MKRTGKCAEQDKRAAQEKVLDALIAELLRMRALDPPMSDEDIRRVRLLAPIHWILEIIAVLARIDPGAVDDALLFLDDMKPTTIQGVPVLKRAADLSISLNHHLFDTLYHAVALEEGATLVTADAAYFDKAKHLGGIELLSDFAI